jgi:predicted metal-dependent phosphoesterase TrpH
MAVKLLQLKIDLHVHTHYSHDSVIKPKELVSYARKRGLDAVAITDHGRFDGALKIAKQTDFFIIPGIEIQCLNGHVLGLNLKEPIAQKLTTDEAVELIHKAGGIAIACHPVAFFKGKLRDYANSKFDAVEVINASAFPFNYSVTNSKRIASELGIAGVGGSDAHYGPEIGYAYTLVDSELKTDDIVEAISKGACQPFGKAIPLMLRLKRQVLTTFRI